VQAGFLQAESLMTLNNMRRRLSLAPKGPPTEWADAHKNSRKAAIFDSLAPQSYQNGHVGRPRPTAL
jgi:hypothetical protein